MNETIVIDTPQGIAAYRLLAIVHGLELEMKTGMRMGRISALQAARSYGDFKTRAQAHRALRALLTETEEAMRRPA